MKIRVIAKLEVKPPNVVKPIVFEGLKVIDTPMNLAKKYYAQHADEIIYIDIVSSLYQRDIILDSIKDTADQLFIPFGVGGGIKSISDIKKLLHNGADKVILNTYALQDNPSIINEASKIFGSQAISINIEAKKQSNFYECYSDGGKIESGKEVISWAKEVEKRGAGEIIIQAIDKDGLKKGFDLELCKVVVQSVNIPVVVASGAGNLQDIKDVIEYAKPSAVAISSILHYNISSIQEIKEYLSNHNIEVSS